MIGITVSTNVAGRAIARTGRYKRYPVAGLALMTVALVLLAVVAREPSRTTTGIGLAVFGLGFGMVGQVLIVAVQNGVDRRRLGIAMATTSFFRGLGGAIGAAVLGAVFAARLGTTGAVAGGGVTELGAGTRADVIDAVQAVFLVAAPLATLALVVVIFLPEVALQGATNPPRKEQPMSNDAFQSTVLLRSEQSNDEVGVVEVSVPAGWPGPPLHRHAFDEAFYVLEGELTFQLGDQLASAGAGSLTFAPRDSHHTLANPGDTDARYLLICTPGGFEGRFDAEPSKPIPETIVVGPQIARR